VVKTSGNKIFSRNDFERFLIIGKNCIMFDIQTADKNQVG